jgi:hypothetical protein
MISLRDTVKDTITGFTGVVISRCEWINGCVRLGVQATKLKDGIPTEPQHFDEEQFVSGPPTHSTRRLSPRRRGRIVCRGGNTSSRAPCPSRHCP